MKGVGMGQIDPPGKTTLKNPNLIRVKNTGEEVQFQQNCWLSTLYRTPSIFVKL